MSVDLYIFTIEKYVYSNFLLIIQKLKKYLELSKTDFDFKV